ncbi:LamB/YcsF family protein, partial [Salmonella enterica subsp. enterica serovar Typhimurium]
VKPHGAMYNAIVKDEAQAEAVIKGIKAFGDLPVMLLPGGVAVDVAKRSGLTVIREAFADRNYNPDGTLVSRKEANAVLGSADEVVQRV